MQLIRTFEQQARGRLPLPVYDYFAGGAGDEQTLRENETGWDSWWLVPRQLTGASEPDLSTNLLGQSVAAPIVLAPAAAQRLLHPDGELAAARAAAAAGLVYCLSTRATADLGEVAQAAPDGHRWFQLYFNIDREVTAAMLGRVAGAGYTQVVLTIDLPVLGRRDREDRHGVIPLPDGVQMASHLDAPTDDSAKPAAGGWAVLTWDDLEWIAEKSRLPVICKGVLTAADAELAVQHGASAIVVSNHGGRQLDGCLPTAVALPEVADAVSGRVPVLVDGGVRSGADVVRALALGATAVMIGRPFLWGLAADGERGVTAVLDALIDDTKRTLTLVGVDRPHQLSRDYVRRRS